MHSFCCGYMIHRIQSSEQAVMCHSMNKRLTWYSAVCISRKDQLGLFSRYLSLIPFWGLGDFLIFRLATGPQASECVCRRIQISVWFGNDYDDHYHCYYYYRNYYQDAGGQVSGKVAGKSCRKSCRKNLQTRGPENAVN